MDGSFFGTSFPHLLLMVNGYLFQTYPDIGPIFPKEEYTAQIFGFRIQEKQPAQKAVTMADKMETNAVPKELSSQVDNENKKKKKNKKG